MNAKAQGGADRPKYAVGVDAHPRKLAISIWEDSAPWNPTLHGEIRSCGNDAMLGLMQLPGFYLHASFVLQALVEDPRRFPSAAKLAAYAGPSPTVNTSGEEEERARRRGGTGKPLDGEGRRDIRHYCCEAGQAVLHLCPKSGIGRWGWAMANRGKPRNRAVCAVGRKLVTYAWHIMRGDPTPNRDGEPMFRRKMARLYSELGRERMRELGYPTRAAFAGAMAARFYGALPEAGRPVEP